MTKPEFDDIRPYHDSEIPNAMRRILNDPLLESIAKSAFSNIETENIKDILLSVKTTYDFQTKIMYNAINGIETSSTDGVTIEGFNNLDKNESYLFVSNHRDIVLDSAFLQTGLHDNGFKTTEITFGSNLMKPQMVVDIGKSNKMFKVIRSSNTREFINNSLILSEYIRHTITQKRESVWIAQRNGRTKDGNDITEPGIIKMFDMSKKHDSIIKSIKELNIVPLVISYQIEPCDWLKTRELYLSRKFSYTKTPNEDLDSIINGIRQQKGKVHIKILTPLNQTIDRINIDSSNNNAIYKSVASFIDNQIHSNYHLHNNNYIAFDILNNSNQFSLHYTKDEYRLFSEMMDSKLSAITEINSSEIRDIYLKIYAFPVENHLKTK